MVRPNWFLRNWLVIFSIVWGLFIGLPFLAPLFMEWGWTAAGEAIYRGYSLTCHQLPQRSFFLFGEQTTYSLEQVQAVHGNTIDPLILRQFIGNEAMGWKVAWSDRMVSMYSTMLPAAWLWQRFGKRLGRLSLVGFILLLVPMAVDGTSHVISDLAGISQGYRDTNEWLVQLTHNAFSPAFYAGEALGSFNSWMRLLTGVLFAVGVVWFLFPRFDETFCIEGGEQEYRAPS